MPSRGGCRPWILAGVTILLAACHGDRDALRSYLSEDHPRLTAGSANAIAAFAKIAALDAPAAERLEAFDASVLEPYRAIVERLSAWESRHEPVAEHHARYLAAARRQLRAFETAREAIQRGEPLTEVGGMLRIVRSDLDQWLVQVRKQADETGVELVDR